MQRYFIEQTKQEVTTSGVLVIKGEDVHHIVNVMRMAEGNQIICCTKDGHEAFCTLDSLSKHEVELTIVEWTGKSRELPLQVHIASGLPKGDKLEWIIQKGTELGASSFIPFGASRSVVKFDDKKAKKKQERWAKIAKEAAEQSQRNKIPKVGDIHTFHSLLKSLHNFDKCVVAYEESSKQGENTLFQSVIKDLPKGSSILLMFGPEGGFSDSEIQALQEEGAIACGLGPRILRAETAPLYALAAVSYQTELLRGE
ncbi:16S rRNA (uracil(1498)-N(3))-methyltransferase [Bacillus changyiensis]|uniref:16S rRNA (uracil(1498)-N(3))-methyltransferase n=1 Tax=Bacillus changyiensis TaxID=3004103 RepID=UPI0022E60339|nr:16S rRNA (uracil(1498)-N(3))-methyltransferase [Bacillus changyiensis]MDA1474784.1 16S rRNA (uracil(1498)-N(3))-methyltransferase [Bacillus changyiensis]